ncbi:MAG: hypothetical protein JSR45_13950 [Proteobacteria bacterium]|nr:hypothetical protein [Pseudomonadota bacterium]
MSRPRQSAPESRPSQTTEGINRWWQLKNIAEVTSLVTIVALIYALVVNTIIFAAWGLDFAAIATPVDIGSSGITVALKTIPGVFGMLSSFAIGNVRLFRFSSKRYLRLSGVHWIIFPPFAFGMVCVAIELWYEENMNATGYIIDWYKTSINPTLDLLKRNGSMSLVTNYIACAVAMTYFRALALSRRATRSKVGLSIACVIALLLTSEWPILDTIEYGIIKEPTYIKFVNYKPHCAKMLFLWSGEKYLIARCYDGETFVPLKRTMLETQPQWVDKVVVLKEPGPFILTRDGNKAFSGEDIFRDKPEVKSDDKSTSTKRPATVAAPKH